MKNETVIFYLIMSQDFPKIKVKVKVELFDQSEIDVWAQGLGLRNQPTDYWLYSMIGTPPIIRDCS